MKASVLFFISLTSIIGIPGALVFAHSEEALNTRVIRMTEEGFSPKEITIIQGGMVIFENVDVEPHWPASNIHPTHTIYPGSDIQKCGETGHNHMFDACEGVRPGEEYSFSFKEPGEWKFHDHLYSQFGGSVTVLDDSDYDQGTAARQYDTKTDIWEILSETTGSIFLRVYYWIAPKKRDEKLAELDMRTVALNGEVLRFWMKVFGPEQILSDLIKDAKYGCHLEAHLVGRISYQVYGTSPLEVFDDRCQFGYFHGLLEAFIGDQNGQNIVQEMDTYCASLGSLAYRIKCFHGIGHGLLVFNNYDLPEAVAQCRKLQSEARSYCYDGAFMENAVTTINFDVAGAHESEWISSDPYFPCNAFPENHEALPKCYFNQALVLAELFERDISEVVQTCGTVLAPYVSDCYQGIGYHIAAFALSAERASSICKISASEKYQRNCVAGAVTLMGFVWGPQWKPIAEDICSRFSESIQQECSLLFKEFQSANKSGS